MQKRSAKQQKWNQRHDAAVQRMAEQKDKALSPCTLLKSMQSLIPKPGKGLELASGLGSNSQFLAKLGWRMDAWDFSDRALEYVRQMGESIPGDGSIHTRCIDLENPSVTGEIPTSEGQFDLIVVSFYLHRPLCTEIPRLLKPGGVLFYQTFHQRKDPAVGPGNMEFLLEPNELLRLFSGLEVMFYWDGMGTAQHLDMDGNSSCLVAKAPQT